MPAEPHARVARAAAEGARDVHPDPPPERGVVLERGREDPLAGAAFPEDHGAGGVAEDHVGPRPIRRQVAREDLRRDHRRGAEARRHRARGEVEGGQEARARVVHVERVARVVEPERVGHGVRGRRDERGELVDPDATARVLELAALLQRVDERDRVDGLALCVEGQGGAVDLRVALPVEVAGVEDLADGPDRPGGEHHRAEDGLLGIEILRGDRGGLRELGDLGHAIQKYTEAQGFSVVREYCGHGIGRIFHEDPQVLHYGKPGTGERLQPGMTFTVEPMINLGHWKTEILEDRWTAVTADGSLSAQFEHTVLVTDTEVRVGKVPTQPRQEESVVGAARAVGAEDVDRFTHGTTIATTAALLVLAGEVIRPFAWVMSFGIFTGTFSSIYIAAPVLLYIERRWPGEDARGARAFGTRAPGAPTPSAPVAPPSASTPSAPRTPQPAR